MSYTMNYINNNIPTNNTNNNYNTDESFQNSNDIAYINNNPINYHLSNNGLSSDNTNSYFYNIKSEPQKIKYKKKSKSKNAKINLNDPKLVDAYNEGYYGVSSIPKHYYIYPKFAKMEKNKNKKSVENSNNINQYLNNNTDITFNQNKINKENNYDILFNKSTSRNNYNNIMNSNINNNKNNYMSIYTNYINYPYPYFNLINISRNFFGQFHTSNPIENNNNMINYSKIKKIYNSK